MNNEKAIYIGLTALITSLAFVAALLSFLGVMRMALGIVFVAIGLIPLASHFRMRRTLAALRRINGGTSTSIDYQPISSRIDVLERKIDENNQTLKAIDQEFHSPRSSNDASMARYANEVRRESRMIRLVADQILKKGDVNE